MVAASTLVKIIMTTNHRNTISSSTPRFYEINVYRAVQMYPVPVNQSVYSTTLSRDGILQLNHRIKIRTTEVVNNIVRVLSAQKSDCLSKSTNPLDDS